LRPSVCFSLCVEFGRHLETMVAIFQTCRNQFSDHKLSFRTRLFPPIPLICLPHCSIRRVSSIHPDRGLNPSLPHTIIEFLTGTEKQGGDGGAKRPQGNQQRLSRKEESDPRAGIFFRVHPPRTPALLETFPSSLQSQMHSPTVMTHTSDLGHPTEAPTSNSTATDQPTSPSDITPQRRSRVFLISDLDLNEVPTLNTPTVINFSASATATV
jgi:hypothetical protein